MVIGGEDGALALHARDGTPLAPIGRRAGAARAVSLHPGGAHVAVAAAGRRGDAAVYALAFSTVHGLHRTRYASRQVPVYGVVSRVRNTKKLHRFWHLAVFFPIPKSKYTFL